MATLVTLTEFKAYVGYTKNDLDLVLTGILDGVEDCLESRWGQVFGPAESVTDEVHDGDGSGQLFLRRPASAITHIKVASDSDFSTPDETVAAADLRIHPTNPRRVVRLNGGLFPCGLLNLAATYMALENLPAMAAEALKEAAALMFRIRGREHVASESLGDLGAQVLETERYFSRLPAVRAGDDMFRGLVLA